MFFLGVFNIYIKNVKIMSTFLSFYLFFFLNKTYCESRADKKNSIGKSL